MSALPIDRDELKAVMREVLAELLAEQRPSSAEFTRNASGVVQIACKEYAANVAEARAAAAAAFRHADEDFPYAKPGK